jgi:hypothetical protein
LRARPQTPGARLPAARGALRTGARCALSLRGGEPTVSSGGNGSPVAVAGGRYRRLARRLTLRFRRADREVEHLHAVEREGEVGASPYIVLAGVALFLLPIFLLMLALAYLAYFLA